MAGGVADGASRGAVSRPVRGSAYAPPPPSSRIRGRACRAHLENCIAVSGVLSVRKADRNQENKGTRWMPWHQRPMKDVDGCDKPRGAAERASIRGFPNGETHPW